MVVSNVGGGGDSMLPGWPDCTGAPWQCCRPVNLFPSHMFGQRPAPPGTDRHGPAMTPHLNLQPRENYIFTLKIASRILHSIWLMFYNKLYLLDKKYLEQISFHKLINILAKFSIKIHNWKKIQCKRKFLISKY